MSLPTFARNAISDYKRTAAVAPSSKQLARAMVDPWRGAAPRLVVEFGPGTGVMTRELLRLLPADGTLLAFEISASFAGYLSETISDPRLQVVRAGAETAALELRRRGIVAVNGIVSSLGIGFMDSDGTDAIFRPLLPLLGESGTVTQFQYAHRMRWHGGRLEFFNAGSFMERYFHSVESTLVLMNLPPALVITCRGARSFARTAPGTGNGTPLGYTRS